MFGSRFIVVLEPNIMEVKSLKELQDIFDRYLLLEDRDVVKVLVGTVIANQIDSMDPVWILLVAASSGGKSELLQAFNDIVDSRSKKKIITPISDLTPNTFASGQVRVGEETSLLHKMPRGGIMSFKDFTSILSKNDDAKREIMSQLREIYDGFYDKLTGNSKNVNWRGKLGALAGCTEVIYEHLESLSAMGDRFAMYSITQPDRKEVLGFVINQRRQNVDKEESRADLRAATKNYVEFILENKEKVNLTISQKTEDEIIEMADFCTKVRSGVIMDDRFNRVNFVPTKEMPMRLVDQLISLGTAFVIMRNVENLVRGAPMVTDLDMTDIAILRKIAFDSIPIKRRMALKLLATYALGARTAGLATKIGYETKVIGGWLSQLNGLGICDREKKGGPQGDLWSLKNEYAETMIKFEHIKVIDELLEDKSIVENAEDAFVEQTDYPSDEDVERQFLSM